jgi:predicted enzyme related to lactoylglutathione lyase
MKDVKEYTPGQFCWAELGTKDTSVAKKFYSSLLGWTFKENDMGGGMIYTICQLDGKDIVGLYTLDPQHPTPPGWINYVSVKNADKSANRVKELGGTVVMPPMEIPDVGKFGLFKDPQNAVIGVWQPGKHIGAQMIGEPGAMVWNELVTPDVEKAEEFYTRLFDWTSEKMKMERFTYTRFKIGDKGGAGMLPTPPEAKGLPPIWTIYFAVEDCDKTADQVKSLGGTIMRPPEDIPKIGRFAIFKDPQDAMFAVIHPVPM